jgi:predicted RND superfamily exporter protein
MDAFASWLVRRPVFVLAGFAAITAVLGTHALRVRIESSISSVLPADDPGVEFYDTVRETFGSDEIGVVGVRSEDLFSERTLLKIRAVTSALADIEGVQEVLSITNAVDPSADAFRPPLLVPVISPAADAVEKLKKKLLATPLFRVNLVAPDFSGAAINIFFEDLTDIQYVDLRIDEQIAAIMAAHAGPEKFFYTGAAHVKQVATQDMRHDLFVFTPIALALVLITLWLSFRRMRAVVLPLLSVAVAVAWTLGVMVLLGKSINLGTFVLPPLLLVVGSSYAIHVLAQYYEVRDADPQAAPSEIVRRSVRHVTAPLLISAGTTMIGFGALMANRIIAIWDLGMFSVIGIAFLAMSSLLLLPALLQLWPGSEKPAPRAIAEDDSGRLRRLLARLGARSYSSRRSVLGGAALIALVALLGLPRISVDSDFLAYFDPESEVRSHNQVINDTIVGSNPFYLVIDSGEPGTLERWEVLRQIKDLQRFLATLPGVSGTVSLVDYLEIMEPGFNTGSEDDFVIDEEGNLVAFEAPAPFWEDPTSLVPILTMVKKHADTFASVVTPDFARGNILVRSTLSGSRQIEALLSKVRGFIAKKMPATLNIQATGTLVLMTGTTSEIITGQLRSLSLALVVIFAVMSMMFLSMRVGLLAILPNLLAIVVFFGLLGWFGIYLNLGTSLIATIALGIAVDSTIHFMTRLSRELGRVEDQALALKRTLNSVGAPVVFTTIALFLGFLTFAGSRFVPIRSFGQLTATTIVAALMSNLIVLPALLATTKIITLWDLVGLKLGDDPTRTIPLLRGLRPAQARLVVLMGRLRHFAPGEAIVRTGDTGREMYVMVDGTSEVLGGDPEHPVHLMDLKRGDMFGEMAMVRGEQRSADVIARDQVEALELDENSLERLQRRYPRIASRVLANMTRILSDRLQRVTDRLVSK